MSSLAKLSTQERFQQMYDEIAGENEEEKRRTLEYVNILTEKEADVYLKFIKRGLGEENIVLTTSDREFLQRAWKKIHVKEDIFQRNSSSNLFREFYDGIADAHNGFDDIVFEIKDKNLFKIVFLDYKTGDATTNSPWYYTPKRGYHLSRRALNKKQLIEFISEEQELLNEFGFFTMDNEGIENSTIFIKLFYDRNRNYYIIGNDWIIKFENREFEELMIKLSKQRIISEQICMKMLKGIKEQNAIIALAQNGHILQFNSNKKNPVLIEEEVTFRFNNETITLNHKFFLPKLIKENKKRYISIEGDFAKHTQNTEIISSFIPKIELPVGLTETDFAKLYSKLKRKFLMNLFNSKKLTNLENLYDNRGLYGLDVLVSSDYKNKISDLIKQPETLRGISYFYDYIQPILINFLKSKQLTYYIGKDESEDLYDQLVHFLSDTAGFFDRLDDSYYSKDLFEKKPCQLFLFDNDLNDHKIPPTFSFRKGISPKTGVILVDFRDRILHYGKYFKRAAIQLHESDLLLNFPFTWDSNYGYFSFTQKGNNLTQISKAWWVWLEKEGFLCPSGPSGRIPNESVIVMLLEWWRRNSLFIYERVLEDSSFVRTCSKNDLEINYSIAKIQDKFGNSYLPAKVSIRGDNSAQHKNKWKYYSYYNDSFIRLLQILESLICDITVKEREVNPSTISNWNSWLKDNWLDEFERIKPYFVE